MMAFRVRNVLQISGCVLQRNMSSGASKRVGFIGLGNMGGHMASNLIKKGHKLNVFDISAPACEALKAKGATVSKSYQDVAKSSDFVVTMLPNNDIVSETYKEMVSSGVNSSTIFIDSSTIDPMVAQAVQKLVKGQGATFVDAPVSGGVPGAAAATLTFMVGGYRS
uniref:3-hydroxyisobutyrate dehydrogenase n=1 Tax=Phlebotomus papatasi TaxID=29031 RepID=A0A1B0DC71_PHLPP